MPFFSQQFHQKISHATTWHCPCDSSLPLVPLATSCTEKERSSLLHFVSELSQDGGLRSSWENTMDCCNWEGITCSSEKTVTDVFLACTSLEGHVSVSLGILTGLPHLNLPTTRCMATYRWSWFSPAALFSLTSALTNSMEICVSCLLQPLASLYRYSTYQAIYLQGSSHL